MTALTPGTDGTTPSTRRPGGLPRRVLAGLRNFSRRTVRMWIVLLGAAIVAVMIFAVASNVKDVDRRVRDADRRDALTAAYAADLRAYDIAVRDRNDCLADVARSNLNRGQHEANVVAHEQQIAAYRDLLALTPPSYQLGIQIIIDRLNGGIAALKAGPLLSTPPRTVEECPPVPNAPVAPDVNGTP